MFNAQDSDPDSLDLIAVLILSCSTSTKVFPNVTNIAAASATISGLGVVMLKTWEGFRFFGVSTLLSPFAFLDLALSGWLSFGLEDVALFARTALAFGLPLGAAWDFSLGLGTALDFALRLGAAWDFALPLGAASDFVFGFGAAFLIVSLAGLCWLVLVAPFPSFCSTILLKLSFPSHHA